jgi:transcription elongation factor S-II
VLSGKKVSVEILKETQIGLVVGKLRKHENKEVCSTSRQLVDSWKNAIPSSLNSSSSSVSTPEKDQSKINLKKSEEKWPNSHSNIRPESASVKEEKKRKAETTITEPKKKSAPSPSGGDPRDTARELLSKSLGTKYHKGELEPDEVAKNIEEELFNIYNGVTKDYKAKIRSLTFNLKNEKNPMLRRDVLGGIITAAKLCVMPAQDLASPEDQAKRAQIEKYHLEAAQIGKEEATTDMFQCGRCKNRACTYYQLQTRSADEPMTTFVTCTVCKNRWVCVILHLVAL